MPKVREIMTVDIKSAELDTTLEELASMMRDEDVGAIPVLEDGELIGIVTDRDIVVRCIAEGKNPADVAADAVISENVQIVDPEIDVDEASRIMAERQIRRLPVVEDERLVGMVSLGDLAVKHSDERVSGRALEDISEGVKPSRAQAAPSRKEPVPISRGRALRGAGRRSGQGISQREQQLEQGRQQRVSPARAKGRSSGRRKVS